MQEDRPAKTVSTENRNRKEDVELHIQHTRTQLCATITRWTVIPKIHYTRFPVTSPYKGSCQLVASLLATSRCNRIWETTRHNRHNGLFCPRQLVTDLLRGNWCNGFWPYFRAFPIAAARLWNSLSSHVTVAPSLHLLLSS